MLEVKVLICAQHKQAYQGLFRQMARLPLSFMSCVRRDKADRTVAETSPASNFAGHSMNM